MPVLPISHAGCKDRIRHRASVYLRTSKCLLNWLHAFQGLKQAFTLWPWASYTSCQSLCFHMYKLCPQYLPYCHWNYNKVIYVRSLVQFWGTKGDVNKHFHGWGNMVGPKSWMPLPDRASTPAYLFFFLTSGSSSLPCLLHSKKGAVAKGSFVHADVGINVTASAGNLFCPGLLL